MDINQVYNLVKYRANKSGFDGNISPNDFNLLWVANELRYFNRIYTQYAVNQRIGDALSKFKSTLTPFTIDTAGSYPIPADMLHVDSITHVYNGTQVEVKRVDNDRLASYLSSTFDAPSPEFPIYVQYGATLQFYPIDIANAYLVYLKKPTPAKWGYTLVNNRPVYSQSESIQPLWYDSDLDAIIYMVLQDIGINLRDGELENFSQTQAKQTA